MKTPGNNSSYGYTLSLNQDDNTVIDFTAYKAEHPRQSHYGHDEDAEEFEIIIFMPSNGNDSGFDPDGFDPPGAA